MDKETPQQSKNEQKCNSDTIKPKISTIYKELCPSKDPQPCSVSQNQRPITMQHIPKISLGYLAKE
jgi:hypothetical protein